MAEKKYNYNKKTSGMIELTGGISQKNGADFPLMNVADLDWGGVQVDENTVFKTTDDLLDYIKGVGGKVNKQEVVSASTYIICDAETKSSYELKVYGDQPAITLEIIRNTNSVATNLSIGDPTNSDNTKYLIKDLNGNNVEGIILEDKKNIIENGRIKANLPAGTYTVSVMSDPENMMLASFVLVITKTTDLSYTYNLYCSTDNKNTKPAKAEGMEKKNGVIKYPGSWKSYENVGADMEDKNKVIWECLVGMEGDQNNQHQTFASDPVQYIRAIDIDNDIKETASFPVSIYKAVKKGNNAPSTPTGGSFNYTTKKVNLPSGWSDSVDSAVTAYGSKNCEVYVSYNNYVAYYEDGAYDEYRQTGWTAPSKYIDFDGILKSAEESAKTAANNAISKSLSDLQNAKQLLEDSQEQVAAVLNQMNSDYSWSRLTSSTANNPKYAQITSSDTTLMTALTNAGFYANSKFTVESVEDMNAVEGLTVEGFKDKYIVVNDYGEAGHVEHNVYVGYVPTNITLLTQLAGYSEDLNELRTTVNEMTPEYIRLQATKGFGQNVTWTPITQGEWVDALNTNANKCHGDGGNLTTLPTTGYVIGDFYALSKPGNKFEFYRCDYPISTGFLDILAEKLTLGVSQRTASGNTISSTIQLKVDGQSSSAQIVSDQIVLKGDTIAEAIKAKDLNINNKTYIKQSGEVLLAQGTNGACDFKTDGNFTMAGGKIAYTASNDTLEVSGKIKAQQGEIGGSSGKWMISGSGMYGQSQDGKSMLYLYPGKIRSVNTNYGSGNTWELSQDGSAKFAKGLVEFNPDGTGHIGKTSGNSSYINISSEGVTLHGVNGLTLTATDYANIAANDVVIQSLSTNILGQLNTEDISVGGGSSYFKSDGSGRLANGGVVWDKTGNVTMQGDVTATQFTTLAKVGSDLRPAVKITTFAQIQSEFFGDQVEKAGLADASGSTPVMVVYDYYTENGEVKANKYVVPLLKLGGSASKESYVEEFLTVGGASRFTFDTALTNDPTKITFARAIIKKTTTKNESTTETYEIDQKWSNDNVVYAVVREGATIAMPCGSNWNRYYLTYIIKVIRITVSKNGVSTQYAYLMPKYDFVKDSGSNQQPYGPCITPGGFYCYKGSQVAYGDNMEGKYLCVNPSDGFIHRATSGLNTPNENYLETVGSGDKLSELTFVSGPLDWSRAMTGNPFTTVGHY